MHLRWRALRRDWTATKPGHLTITQDRGLGWHCHGSSLNHGFCKLCGSTLFFDYGREHPTSIAVGSFEPAPALHIAVHICTDEAGAWYDLPQSDADTHNTEPWEKNWHGLKWLDV